MWTITLRNIQFRKRQFLIAIVGVALVFAMALLVTGIRQGFHTEARSTLDGIGGDHWAVPAGTAGPFTSFSVMPLGQADELANLPGVKQADPVVIIPQTVRIKGKFKSLNVIGHRIGGLGEPPLIEGRGARTSGEAVVDKRLGMSVGQAFEMSGEAFTVVGRVSGRTYYGGTATAYISIANAQTLAFKGAPLITAVVMEGRPATAPAGLAVMTAREVRTDLLRPLSGAEQSINTTRLLLWVVAAVIVGAVMYMSALERVRDFAVLKAVGGATRSLVAGLTTEAIVTCLIAAALAIGLAQLLRPTMPLPITFTRGSYLALPVIAVVVGVLASLSGVRRAVRTDPAAAFSGA